MPGFIDTHTHYPQAEILGAPGESLLNWLNRYTFPTELKFQNPEYCKKIADFFIREMLRNGTTTAAVFGTVHSESVNTFFERCHQSNLCMVAGKVMMDRNAPADLCDTPESAFQESETLIHRWHNVGRLKYALTPRFAPTSSPLQLKLAGNLLKSHPGVYLHTHLSETKDEIQWVKRLFPMARYYLDVYEQAGLLGSHSIFAHGIYLKQNELSQLAEAGASIAHCPTSNLFLGSGLFNLTPFQNRGITVGLGSDIGAGTSFSMLKTMCEAYKIQKLQQNSIDPLYLFYIATLGGARCLKLDHQIGSLQPGYDADFIVLDLQASPLLTFRLAHCQSLRELLAVLFTLGDDRLISRTYILGNCLHNKNS